LTPAAAWLLYALEPGNGTADHRVGPVEADAVQSGKDLPAPVDVIDPPAAEPGAGRLLGLSQEIQGAIDLGMANFVAVVAKRFQNPGGYIRTTGVEHGVVISERHPGEDVAVDV